MPETENVRASLGGPTGPAARPRRARLLAIALGTLALLVASPLLLRELGPTAKIRISDGDRFLDVRVWYVSREGATWIRCGDRERDWCRKLAGHSVASLGTGGGVWRGVWVEVVSESGAAARFQDWLEEDHPTLGWLPRLRTLDGALVFRLSSLGRHTPAKQGTGFSPDRPGTPGFHEDEAPHGASDLRLERSS